MNAIEQVIISGTEEVTEDLPEEKGFTSERPISVCVIAGESSGDQHAATLITELRRIYPNAKIFGMGGSHLRAAGVEIIVDSESQASLMGFTELLGSIGSIVSSFKKVVAACKVRNPDLVVLVDYADFNMRMAKKLKKKGRKILYFITPQVWAWRTSRVKQIRKYCDAVAPIFPFEEIFFQQRGVRAEYVGHPFLDQPFPVRDRQTFFSEIGADPNRPAVALLPGSRSSEIDRLIVPMLDGWEILRRSRPGFQALIPLAPGLSLSKVKSLLPQDRKDLFLVDGRAREVLVNSDIGVIASGTATIEGALSGTPFVVIYKLSNFSYKIAKFLVKGVKFFAMPNLIVGQGIVPELLQDEVTGENIALELEKLYGDPKSMACQRDGLARVRERLTTPNTAGRRAAVLASKLLEESSEKTTQRRWSR